jgi:2-keto-4-pentenoate hydratase
MLQSSADFRPAADACPSRKEEMLQDQAEEAAGLLCIARRNREPLVELPPGCRPQSDADAYQIQDAVIRRLGETIGGWKVGAASATIAAFCAPIFARMIRPSPASYSGAELRLIAIEAEIAFRLGRDLPARAAPYERAEVTGGATMHPVIDLALRRFPIARPAIDPRRQLLKWRARLGRRGGGLGEA